MCIGLLRCGKSCRLRWVNYLSPDVKRGNFTPEEEDTIINLHRAFGNRYMLVNMYIMIDLSLYIWLEIESMCMYVQVVKDSISFTRKNRQ